MKSLYESGFTVIETVLFLSISGALAIGILVGTTTSINVQRYRDSVNSLQSFMRQQYSDVANVRNDKLTNSCSGVPDISRGQSNCVILGRYIKMTDSNKFTATTVIGTIPLSLSSSDDLAVLLAYDIKLALSDIDKLTYDTEWGSLISKEDGTSMGSLAILILRSPSSGVIRTFVDTSGTSTLLAILNRNNLKEAKMCVNSNGLFNGSKMAVVINANTTGASGVVTFGDNSGCR